MDHYLGIDVGGSKTHALISNANGVAVGFASAGAGNWEGIGYEGLTRVLLDVTEHALQNAKINIQNICGAGLGIGGFDWNSQRQDHMEAIKPLGLTCPVDIVNDATLGILAGTDEAWGISIVSGTGCNCRGWSKDHKNEGRVVGGAGAWSGEAGGAFDIVERAMRAVTFEWDKRGPETALTPLFIQTMGAVNLDDLIEGLYTGRYNLDLMTAQMVFRVAAAKDPVAVDVIRWAGEQLGEMACGVIRQLILEKESFDVVLIGSLFDGHAILTESLSATIHDLASSARLVRLNVPPVVGGVILGMQTAGKETRSIRMNLIESTRILLGKR